MAVEIHGPSMGGNLAEGEAGEGGDESVMGRLLHLAAVREEI